MEPELLPNLIPFEPGFWGARFELMKRVPAFGVVRRARSTGLLSPGGIVLETTSGSMGIGLAEVCKEDGYLCILVTDESALDGHVRQRLDDLGAHVELVAGGPSPAAAQSARLQRLHELQARYPQAYWTDQYGNPWNRESYDAVADRIFRQLGKVDTLVCTVGTGGSSCGIAEGLRRRGCNLTLVGVDLRGSVLFGLPSAVRNVRGMGNGIEPANVDHTAYDEVHWLSDSMVAAALQRPGLQRLKSTHAIDVGPTSGAAYVVAEWKRQQEPEKTVCAVFPDSGARYVDTFANPRWVAASGLHLAAPPCAPVEAGAVPRSTPDDHWSMLRWNRRPFQEVTGRVWSGAQLVPA